MFFAESALTAASFQIENDIKISSLVVYCVMPIANGYRMYFSSDSYDVLTSSVGSYSVLSATSPDEFVWGKNSSFSIKFDSGVSRINLPVPYFKILNNVMLY